MPYKFNINYAIINIPLKIRILLNISNNIFQILCTKMKHNQYGTGHFLQVKTCLQKAFFVRPIFKVFIYICYTM
jgi:hypothetical protein